MTEFMERRMPRPLSRLPMLPAGCAAILCLAAIPAGCSSTAHDRNGLLGGVTLPALDDPTAVGVLPENGPSLNGFDRTNWPRIVVRIPAASVDAHPTWATPIAPPGLGEESAAFPTPQSALAIEVDLGDELANAAVAPLMTAVDIAISPVRMIMQPPWTVRPEPTGGFDLLPPADIAPTDAPAHD